MLVLKENNKLCFKNVKEMETVMKIFIFSFTRQATSLSLKLYDHFSEHQISCTAYAMEKYAFSSKLTPLIKPLKEQVKDCFEKENVLIFISACGIAVRSIAPFIEQKTTDPCVLVIDEKGDFVISLLSGHIGGGNEFTQKTADFLHATPIISTATDLNHKFSVDTFAKKHNLFLSDLKLAKEVSSSLLDDIPIGLSGIIPDGELPDGLNLSKEKTGICISAFMKPVPFSHTLFLIPKQVVLGIGCKKHTSFAHLDSFVTSILQSYDIHPKSLAAITSIDLKKEEAGLLELAEKYQIAFITYDTDTLLQVPGNFSSSEFVKTITGVDNVCERSTLAYTKSNQLFLKKTAYQGMTIAISLLPVSFHF